MFVSIAWAGCGGKSPAPKESGDDTSQNALARKISVGWGVETLSDDDEIPPRQRVTVSLTDETGAAESIEVGEFVGGCAPSQVDAPENAITALRCWYAGAGTVLQVFRQGGELVIVRAEIDEGGEEPSFEEYKRLPVAVGAVVVGSF